MDEYNAKDELAWLDELDPKSVVFDRREDDSCAARGILRGVLWSLPIWALAVALLAWLV